MLPDIARIQYCECMCERGRGIGGDAGESKPGLINKNDLFTPIQFL